MTRRRPAVGHHRNQQFGQASPRCHSAAHGAHPKKPTPSTLPDWLDRAHGHPHSIAVSGCSISTMSCTLMSLEGVNGSQVDRSGDGWRLV